MVEPRSTLERPPERLIRQFHVGQVGDDTIQTFLTKGFSLAICCQDCPRTSEWTPPDLERRFGEKLGLRIAELVARLACTGEGGCGSRHIAVFPHLYDGEWSWTPPEPR